MKKALAATLATMFMLASVPAFACDGHGDKTAKKGDDEALMTSVDDGNKDDVKKSKKAKKSKEAKKEDKKSEESEGEV